MAAKKQVESKESKVGATKSFSREHLIGMYMQYVLENGVMPLSVYKFCKENKITEQQFYEFFGSFEGLKKEIWDQFFSNTMQMIESSPEFSSFTSREKLLTFYYTFFEILTANRSYVLLILGGPDNFNKNLVQLKGLRKRVKGFAAQLVREGNEEKHIKLLKQSETIVSEATWLQLVFILKFWMEDNSAKFESTDVVIEKSVNTVFDLFETAPLERVIDLGKFLWKERMV